MTTLRPYTFLAYVDGDYKALSIYMDTEPKFLREEEYTYSIPTLIAIIVTFCDKACAVKTKVPIQERRGYEVVYDIERDIPYTEDKEYLCIDFTGGYRSAFYSDDRCMHDISARINVDGTITLFTPHLDTLYYFRK